MQSFIPHTIRVRIPDARQVSVVGDFNGWHSNSDPLVETAPGVWERVVDLAAGKYRYAFFVIDGSEAGIRSRIVGTGSVLRVPEDPDQSFSIVRTEFASQALVA